MQTDGDTILLQPLVCKNFAFQYGDIASTIFFSRGFHFLQEIIQPIYGLLRLIGVHIDHT